MTPVWMFAVDNGYERFRAAIVADADGCCSAWSTMGTGEGHSDSTLNPVDLIRPEYEYADWQITAIEPPRDDFAP